MVFKMRRVIALITDYGYRDPYVGVVKSVIKTINPLVELIDITHEITRHDVYEAAVVLLVSAEYFPRRTIFVCIVDPGVGSERKALVIETNNYYLIGPDNGCLTLLARKDGVKRVFDISSTRFTLREVSHTFHGRDVFAPVSAYLSLGYSPDTLGVEVSVNEIKQLDIPEPVVSEREVEGIVLYIDIYGNIMTNINNKLLNILKVNTGDLLKIVTESKTITCKYVKSFSYVNPGEYACYINSWNYFEIAINRGNAAENLEVNKGNRIVIRK